MQRMRRQRGAAMVEFAIIAIVFFMMLFGIIEVGRALFEYNTLQEAMRRGARVAAVCPASSAGVAAVQNVVVFNTPNSTFSSGILGLTASNINVEYLNSNLTPLSNVPTSNVTGQPYDSGTNPSSTCCISYVRVSLVGFTHRWIIPLFSYVFNVPSMSTVMPAESLGRVSNDNPVTKRCCPYTGTPVCTP